MATKSAHVDTFAADNLPPRDLWPEFPNLEKLGYPERMNCAVELIDRHVDEGRGDRVALIGGDITWTYAELKDVVDRIAHVLVDRYGLVPGNRVLLRSANNPMMTAVYFAIIKAGGIVVATMPLLRAKELKYLVEKPELSLAICDRKLSEEMEKTRTQTPGLKQVLYFGTDASDGLEAQMAAYDEPFVACDTATDDVCLIGFTSGTTGQPKGTMHFHRDMLAICDCYSRQVLKPQPDDRFVGSPPLAFTFGLGGLAVFPLRFGAAATLLEVASPANMIEIIEKYRATVCFTAPTAYRVMLQAMDHGADLSSLRAAVSAGETLPAPVYEAWMEKTGKPMLDGIGSTEMLHIFITNRFDDHRPACTGRPVGGYEAKVLAEDGSEAPRGTMGRLAVRGPAGCRYLGGERQGEYVQDGWNITGDTFVHDEDGYFHFAARNDDIIVSAGYNIAGPEVEAALLGHEAVSECGVIGAPNEARGQIVEAHIVLAKGHVPSDLLVKELQDYVKATIAPYKYPRSIKFVEALPKTSTGKIQRFRLQS